MAGKTTLIACGRITNLIFLQKSIPSDSDTSCWPFDIELIPAGINSISKGQHEVSESLGMDFWRKMRLVILPQAIKVVLPAMGNQFVYVLKMSSLVSIIGIGDLTRKAFLVKSPIPIIDTREDIFKT